MKYIYLVVEVYYNGPAPRITPLKCFHSEEKACEYKITEMQERIQNPRINVISGLKANPNSYKYITKKIELH